MIKFSNDRSRAWPYCASAEGVALKGAEHVASAEADDPRAEGILDERSRGPVVAC